MLAGGVKEGGIKVPPSSFCFYTDSWPGIWILSCLAKLIIPDTHDLLT